MQGGREGQRRELTNMTRRCRGSVDGLGRGEGGVVVGVGGGHVREAPWVTLRQQPASHAVGVLCTLASPCLFLFCFEKISFSL